MSQGKRSPPRFDRDRLTNTILYAYDALGRKTNEVFQGYATNRFTYTPAVDLRTLTDGNNHVTTWNYDAHGRVTSKQDHRANTVFSYGYYPNNWLSNRIDGLSRQTKYAYDA